MVEKGLAHLAGRIQSWYLNIAWTIAGGTPQVQRNVIAIWGLGLPRG